MGLPLIASIVYEHVYSAIYPMSIRNLIPEGGEDLSQLANLYIFLHRVHATTDKLLRTYVKKVSNSRVMTDYQCYY